MTASSTFPSVVLPNISNLPDLCLLIVFDHLPLLDLFNRIPLVCPNWTTLKSAALKRRTRLLLLPPHIIVQKLMPGVVDCPSDVDVFVSVKSKRELPRCDLTNPTAVEQARNLLDTLPLPRDYYGWTTATGGQLFRDQKVDWLMSKLPAITQLTIVLDMHPRKNRSIRIIDYHSTERIKRNNRKIKEQMFRLVTTGKWCSQLTTLRLETCSQYNGQDNLDELMEAINHRMPRLTILHLGITSATFSVSLSGDTLSRLRVLLVNSAQSVWLFKSLSSLSSEHQLRPDLCIALPGFYRPELLQGAKLPTAFDHIQILGLDPLIHTVNEHDARLNLISQLFHALRWLSLPIPPFSGNNAYVLASVLHRLAPLTSLMYLNLGMVSLLPQQNDQQQQPDSLPDLEARGGLLPSLRSLDLDVFTIRSHTDIGNSLPWAQSLPRLQQLTIMNDSFAGFSCHHCECDFLTRDECRHQAVQPLETCGQLHSVRITCPPSSYSATRTDLSAPFQWAPVLTLKYI